MNSEESLWEAVRTLWMKYCGISDEYRMLRDRWLYLYKEVSIPTLPYLKNKENLTFDLLDNHIKELDQLFKDKFNLKRGVMEDYTKSLPLLRKSSLRDHSEIEVRFFDLSTYVGLLKLAFFQRTASSEISHVASGAPKSPERTIGNELFYLAADKCAKRYHECLNIPYGRWDNFITFAPPIGQGYFYGAFYHPSPYLELFHISMSEEQKYFVGSYLALAHEFGHGVLTKKTTTPEGDVITDKVNWYKLLFEIVWDGMFDSLNEFVGRRCEDCIITKYTDSKLSYFRQYEQFIADLFGFRVGGPNILSALWDISFGVTNELELIRNVALLEYIYAHSKRREIRGLIDRINDLLDRLDVVRAENNKLCPTHTNLSECITKIGGLWANIAMNVDKDIFSIIPNRNLGNLDLEGYDISSSIFSNFIKEEFKIKKSEETRLVDSLLSGIPCTDADPRHILHCYYEAYKKSKGEDRPSYPATIQSLAFNKYNKEEK